MRRYVIDIFYTGYHVSFSNKSAFYYLQVNWNHGSFLFHRMLLKSDLDSSHQHFCYLEIIIKGFQNTPGSPPVLWTAEKLFNAALQEKVIELYTACYIFCFQTSFFYNWLQVNWNKLFYFSQNALGFLLLSTFLLVAENCYEENLKWFM